MANKIILDHLEDGIAAVSTVVETARNQIIWLMPPYATVDLESALDSAIESYESRLREMEERKRELLELSKKQQFHQSDQVKTFSIIKSTKELVAVTIILLESMTKEWLVAAPGLTTIVASSFGVNDATNEFIQRGGKVRTIIDVSYAIIDHVQELLDIGEEVRHIDKHGLMFGVFDRKTSVTALNIPKDASLNAPMNALWTNDPTHAEYLAFTFEMLWKQSVPAEERIQELLEQTPL